MPRNGDGSSDNGPIEGHEILHGTTGDDSLQHTSHVAPMPEGEKGDALPGMSGGGTAAPTSSSSEQYGVNEPQKSTSDASESKKRSEPHHASPDRSSHLEQKFKKLDNDEIDMSAAQSEEQERRAREKRVQDAVEHSGKDSAEKRNDGGHADVEMMHGETTSGWEKNNGHKGAQDMGSIAHEADMLQRKKAEKFGGVNLGDDEGHDEHGHRHEHGHPNGKGKEHEHGHSNANAKSWEQEGRSAHANSKSNGHEHEVDGDIERVAHDADMLQRKKAEKFGGVNLGDDENRDGHAHANGNGHAGHATAENRNTSEEHGGSKGSFGQGYGVHAASYGKTDYNTMNAGGATYSEGSKGRGNGGETSHSGGSKENTSGSGGSGVATDADLLQRKKAEKFGGVNLGDD